MAIVLPKRVLPASVGHAPENRVGTGFLQLTDLYTPPISLPVAGNTAISNEIWSAGFDNYMIVATVTAAGGVTTTWAYRILDPTTLAVLATRTISAAVAGPATYVLTFGASSASAGVATRGDAWIAFSLIITHAGGASAQSVTYLGLWCAVR